MLLSQHQDAKQWGLYVKKTTAVEKIVLPVTSTFLRGSVTDGGNGNNSYGLDVMLNVYGPSGGVSYICLCKAQAYRQWVLYTDVKQTGEEYTVYFPITFPNSTLTAVDSVDTPNAFYRTSKLTTNSLVFSVTNTGYTSSTCRAVIIGY